MTIKVTSALMCFLVFCSSGFASESDMQKQIDMLREEMRQMSAVYEKRIRELEEKVASGNEDKAVEEAEHEKHRHVEKTGHIDEGGMHKHQHGILGDKVNIIGGVDSRYMRVDGEKNTLFLHEAKVGAQADIAEWLSGYVTFTKHHGEDVHIEEAYALLRSEELGVSLKPGKFFMDFGPENTAHFFNRRTITFSSMHEGIFGSESWADTGVQFGWDVPVDFSSHLAVSLVDGDNASTFGDGENEVSNNNMPVAANWVNAFDTEYGFFRLGNSMAYGQWDMDDKHNVYLLGTDAYYRIGNFDAQCEVIYRWKDLPDSREEDSYGYYAWGAYTVPVGFKYLKGIEFLAGFGQFIPDLGDRETKVTPQISFLLNDFAKLRATYEVREQYPKDNNDNRFITQFALEF